MIGKPRLIAATEWNDNSRVVVRIWDDDEAAVHTELYTQVDKNAYEHGSYFPLPLTIGDLELIVKDMNRRKL